MYYLLFISEQAIWQNTKLFFREFTTMSKINHMKKVIEDLNVFREYVRFRQEVSDDIQTIIYFIKYTLQISIENDTSCEK